MVTATVVGLATGYGLVIEKQLHQNLQVVQIDSLLLLTLKVLRISTRYSKCFVYDRSTSVDLVLIFSRLPFLLKLLCFLNAFVRDLIFLSFTIIYSFCSLVGNLLNLPSWHCH